MNAQQQRTGPRTTTACNRCRRKRGRCDGEKPACGPCAKAGAECEYELGMDRRKPYAKSVVQAMQLRIDTLEAQLAALTGEVSADPTTTSAPSSRSPRLPAPAPPVPQPPVDTRYWNTLVGTALSASSASTESASPDSPPNQAELHPSTSANQVTNESSEGAASIPPRSSTASAPGSTSATIGASNNEHRRLLTGRRPPLSAAVTGELDPEMDKFRGGLALNAHGELRYYGPTSSYRSLLVASPSVTDTDATTSGPSATLQALRSYSLTRAPIPTAAPSEPIFPTRPPDLPPDLTARLFRLAFEFCFAHYNIVPERQFYQDLQMFPTQRTQFYSPFLMHVVLAVGCRYLQPEDNYPPEICGLLGDPDTRGDVFINWARFLLDQEWYNPSMSTIRGLLVLGLYMAGRGFDGPCQMFVSQAAKLAEDFGLNLGPHRFTQEAGAPISSETFASRTHCFWSTYSQDCISSLYIGRKGYFTPDMIDIPVPAIVPELDYDAPLYRSSAFAWSSRLLLLAGRVLSDVYSPSLTKTAQQRKALVPELHLKLESWNHDLPSYLRANTTDAAKAPHPHILVLNMTYHYVHIALHRPFFRPHSTPSELKQETTDDISTEKCLVAAGHIVRLVKLLKHSAGLSRAAPGVQLAAFSAGTLLALAAFPDERSSPASAESSVENERRTQAKKDLQFLVEALKEIGTTWTTALTSAGVLEAVMIACDPASLTTPPLPTRPYMPTPPLTDLPTALPLPTVAAPLSPSFQALLNPSSADLLQGEPFSLLPYGLGLSGGEARPRSSSENSSSASGPFLPLGSQSFRAIWDYGESSL
ncbi:hypothetical protein JCM10908_002575 [Rhodotorula pacifica]|uniref:uncharacterized protein n=1 Tax=Rhodotorula pacifica TaxID=1495444 RepID=UPI00317FADD6